MREKKENVTKNQEKNAFTELKFKRKKNLCISGHAQFKPMFSKG